MEDIIIVDHVESHEDKVEKYIFTGDPEGFIKLEEAYLQHNIKYAFVNSVDKLIREVLETDIYAAAGDYMINSNIPVYYRDERGKLPAPNSQVSIDLGGVELSHPEVYKTGQFGIAYLCTRPRNPTFGSDDDLIKYQNIYRPAQYRIPIELTVDELYRRVYPIREPGDWIYQITKENILNYKSQGISLYDSDSEPILESRVIPPNLVVAYRTVADIFGISPLACPVLLNFSRANFLHILSGGSVLEMTKLYELLLDRVNCEARHQNNLVWRAIENWIAREFNIPFSGQFTNIEIKTIQKRRAIIHNKFLSKSCPHMLRAPKMDELKLVGDFYQCEHGNRIVCRHTVHDRMSDAQISEFFNEFSEEIDNGVFVCKICGVELLKNPDLVIFGFDPSIANRGYDDEFRKYLFKKCMIMISQINFITIVSSDFVYRIAGLISASVFPFVLVEFNKIEKIKGVPEDVIGAFKEIISNIYIYCAYANASISNSKIFMMRGDRAPIKHIDTKYIHTISKRLEQILSVQIERTKNLKPLSFVNITQSIIGEINRSNAVKLPQEVTKNAIQFTTLYEYFAPIADMSDFPNIKSITQSEHQYIENINKLFIDLLHSAKFIGEAVVQTPDENGNSKTICVYSKEFKQYVDHFASLKSIEYEWFKNRIKMYWHIRNGHGTRPLAYNVDEKPIGYNWGTKGGVHRHRFDSGVFDKSSSSKKVLFKDIALDENVTQLYCSICGEAGSARNITDEITQDLILKSKHRYFENYCPKNTIHDFKGEKCVACHYIASERPQDNIAFLKSHELPKNKITLSMEAAPKFVKRADCTPNKYSDAKFVSGLSKEAYYNFWNNLCAYEDITYKNLLLGVRGDESIARIKLRSQFIWLNNLLSRIVNIVNMPNKHLQQFTGSEKLLYSLIVRISQYINEQCVQSYEYLRNAFIEIFNELPKSLAEHVMRELVRSAETGAMSEEKTKVEAMIGYKNKMVDERIDIDEGGEKGDNFTYENFDYDGHNEKS